jgi:hypothetical protein
MCPSRAIATYAKKHQFPNKQNIFTKTLLGMDLNIVMHSNTIPLMFPRRVFAWCHPTGHSEENN